MASDHQDSTIDETDNAESVAVAVKREEEAEEAASPLNLLECFFFGIGRLVAILLTFVWFGLFAFMLDTGKAGFYDGKINGIGSLLVLLAVNFICSLPFLLACLSFTAIWTNRRFLPYWKLEKRLSHENRTDLSVVEDPQIQKIMDKISRQEEKDMDGLLSQYVSREDLARMDQDQKTALLEKIAGQEK